MAQILSAPSTLSSELFDERIASRTARVGIVGLGYAGLPLAMAFAEAGFDVVGIDLNRERVQAIADHRSYLVDVPVERYAGVDGKLLATTDYAAVSQLDALTICVPTPLSKTRTPDLSYVVAAAESVADHMTTDNVEIGADSSDAQLAEIFLHHRVLVVPIVEDERVTGIVTRADFFRALAERFRELAP